MIFGILRITKTYRFIFVAAIQKMMHLTKCCYQISYFSNVIVGITSFNL